MRQRAGRKQAVTKSSDRDLARAAAGGDRAAQREVVDRLLDRTALTVRCLAGNDPELDDLVQQAIVEILQALGSFRGESSLETWAQRITARTAMRRLKQRRWRGKIVLLDSTRETTSDRPGPDRQLNRHRVASRLQELIGTLSEERRQVVTLRLVLGHGVDEIAELTGMKINTVRDRLAVARRQLRKKIHCDPLLREYRDTVLQERRGI
jgi:RNA polymerase sigma-70 factor (ECF subfamily)